MDTTFIGIPEGLTSNPNKDYLEGQLIVSFTKICQKGKNLPSVKQRSGRQWMKQRQASWIFTQINGISLLGHIQDKLP